MKNLSRIALAIGISAAMAGCPPKRDGQIFVQAAPPEQIVKVYLEWINANDLTHAKMVWCVSPRGREQNLDGVVGMTVAMHRLTEAVSKKFGKGEVTLGEMTLVRADHSTAAIDATLKALEHAVVKIEGDTCELIISDKDAEGKTITPFYAMLTWKLRREGAVWRIDWNAMTGTKEAPAEIDPHSWSAMLAMQVEIMMKLADEIEAGKFSTTKDAEKELRKRVEQRVREAEKSGRQFPG